MQVYKYFTMMVLTAAMMLTSIQAYAAEIDTITIENNLMWDGEVPADIGWKTKQDKGQWIEEIEAVDGAGSLILVINNLGSLMYLSKNAEEEWTESFRADCVISGGDSLEIDSIYGVYSLKKAFGNMENPGSLLPYRDLTGSDYWFINPTDERFGDIYTTDSSCGPISGAVNLRAMKTFFNYGMVAKNAKEDASCSSLLFSCVQPDSNVNLFPGIQITEESLRMLVQCADEETCMIIVGSVDDLANL